MKNLGGSGPACGFVGEFKLWLQAHSFGGLRCGNLTPAPPLREKFPNSLGNRKQCNFSYSRNIRYSSVLTYIAGKDVPHTIPIRSHFISG